MSRNLTKSKFKTGCECPTKLYYGSHKEYMNKKLDDPFLQALAKGGFQVGALAQVYNEGGVLIDTLNQNQALSQTAELMSQDKALIFEAAFLVDDLFIRVDVLRKNGNEINLYEVKAKSIDYDEHETFYDKRKLKAKKPQKVVVGKWRPYLLDVAFQAYVVSKLYPDHQINSHLTVANKSKKASVDGLNQLFLIAKSDKGLTRVKIKEGTSKKSVGDEILVHVPVNEEVETLWASEIYEDIKFEDFVNMLKHQILNDQKPSIDINSKCKKCEFRAEEVKLDPGHKSGFDECWSPIYKASKSPISRPLSIDIWYFAAEKALGEGKYFADQLEESDFTTESRRERQWLQVVKSKSNDSTPDIRADALAEEILKWNFPLNFIDFETSMVAIPFNKGRRPYEQMAFQFSHHLVHKNGLAEHKTQYLNLERGKFPNFDFVRNLRKALSGNTGTVFRFHNHENTVLRQIRSQLLDSKEMIVWNWLSGFSLLQRLQRTKMLRSGTQRGQWLICTILSLNTTIIHLQMDRIR